VNIESKLDTMELAKSVISTEIEALQEMSSRLNGEFQKAIHIILETRGRVILVGMGKSGLIGNKIAATFASTGTPSFSVHPGEAFHGDLGMIQSNDIVLMISNSGETDELIRLLPFLTHQKNTLIVLTGNLDSILAKYADAVLDVSVSQEACNNNLAPTSSTTATLVMGDALSVVLSTLRGFQPTDFARFHPGGNLGKKLLASVADVMHRQDLPICTDSASFREVVQTITSGRLGLVMVMEGTILQGVITDGDIRRAFDKTENPMHLSAKEIMTSNPMTIEESTKFSIAENRMHELKINSLIVKNNTGLVVGVLQIFDIASAEDQD
jgi:arabinose-5-phosphate isomerase